MEDLVRRKQRVIAQFEAQMTRGAGKLSDRIAELLSKWFEEWYTPAAPSGLEIDDLLEDKLGLSITSILSDMGAVAKIGAIPRDVVIGLIKQAYEETGGFGWVFDQLLTDARKLDAVNGSLHQRLNDIEISPSSFDPIKQRLLTRVLEQLAPSPITLLAANKGVRIVSNAILRGASLRETTAALEREIGNTIRGAAVLIARDALHGYDGAVNDEIRVAYDLQAFRYVGSVVDGSRPHCRTWVEKHLLTREYMEPQIAALHAAGDPDGFRPETTWENFAQYRGGWNCRHQAIPTRVK